jgi:two-component system chemotaxis response regulator CheB
LSSRPSVLVVDDSPLVCRLIGDLLEESGEFRVAGIANDGMDAIRKVHALQPDLVTLDVQMPELDGLQALGYIMSESPRPVVMLSALESPRGGDLTIRALELGAVDFVSKPLREDALDHGALRTRLLDALQAARGVNLGAAAMLARPRLALKAPPRAAVHASRVVAIAASTGGPRALAELVPALPAELGAAVLVVQHMPAGFTASLARRLDRLSPLPVREAEDGEAVLANHVYIAPGGRHMVVRTLDGEPRISVHDGPPVAGLRPSADTLFESVATIFGSRAVGVVLTGMGRDGTDGLKLMRHRGAYAVVQDRDTSTVFGMPLMALTGAGADEVVPLSGVARSVLAGLIRRGTPEVV